MCDHSQVLSMFAYVSLISHLAIFPRSLASSSFPELFTLLLQPSSFLPCLPKTRSTHRCQPPLPTETPHPIEALACTALGNCVEVSSQDPCPTKIPWASKLHSVFQVFCWNRESLPLSDYMNSWHAEIASKELRIRTKEPGNGKD